MISDTLSEAGEEIRRYLDDEVMGQCYQGDTRTRLEILLLEMESLRRELDTPPGATLPVVATSIVEWVSLKDGAVTAHRRPIADLPDWAQSLFR